MNVSPRIETGAEVGRGDHFSHDALSVTVGPGPGLAATYPGPGHSSIPVLGKSDSQKDWLLLDILAAGRPNPGRPLHAQFELRVLKSHPLML